jgi:hypothetical protein
MMFDQFRVASFWQKYLLLVCTASTNAVTNRHLRRHEKHQNRLQNLLETLPKMPKKPLFVGMATSFWASK